MLFNRKKKRSDTGEVNYWQSYSDMMAALLLVFVLIITFTMVQYKAQFKQEEEALQLKTDELMDKESEIDAQADQIAIQKAQLEEQSAALVELQSSVDEKKLALEELQDELNAQQITLLAEEANSNSLKQTLEEQQNIMKEQQLKIENLIGVKAEIIEALQEEFANSDINITVDESTGAIRLQSSVLFDVGKYDLKSGGKELLNKFLPRYINVLMSDQYRDYVAEIIIEGHADSTGDYMDNLKLSQNRAYAVAEYCLQDNSAVVKKSQLEALRKVVTANGRSFSDPILDEDGNEDKDASRRVEFKFKLKDDEMISEMKNILDTGLED